MFLVRGVDGVQRALIPGEFRSRRMVEAVIETTKPAAVTGPGAQGMGARSQREALLQSYGGQSLPAEPAEVRFAHEIMTAPVFSIGTSTSIEEVTQIFTMKRFRHIPIVERAGGIVGLISDRDILRHRAAIQRHNEHENNKTIETIMIREVLSARPSALIRDVAQVMLDERIGSMPILDASETLVGIITRSDIVRAVVRHGPVRIWA